MTSAFTKETDPRWDAIYWGKQRVKCWSYKPRLPKEQQKTGKGKEKSFPHISEVGWSCLDFGLPTCGKINFCYSSQTTWYFVMAAQKSFLKKHYHSTRPNWHLYNEYFNNEQINFSQCHMKRIKITHGVVLKSRCSSSPCSRQRDSRKVAWQCSTRWLQTNPESTVNAVEHHVPPRSTSWIVTWKPSSGVSGRIRQYLDYVAADESCILVAQNCWGWVYNSS